MRWDLRGLKNLRTATKKLATLKKLTLSGNTTWHICFLLDQKTFPGNKKAHILLTAKGKYTTICPMIALYAPNSEANTPARIKTRRSKKREIKIAQAEGWILVIEVYQLTRRFERQAFWRATGELSFRKCSLVFPEGAVAASLDDPVFFSVKTGTHPMLCDGHGFGCCLILAAVEGNHRLIKGPV